MKSPVREEKSAVLAGLFPYDAAALVAVVISASAAFFRSRLV
jgi:hypothetical protein